MTWKKIAIIYLTEWEKNKFFNWMNKHPKIKKWDGFFYDDFSEVSPEDLDNLDEGSFDIKLKPGWCFDDDLHEFSAESRPTAKWYLDASTPCCCKDCMSAHNSHVECTDPNDCAFVSLSHTRHLTNPGSDYSHEYCIPNVCPDVKKSHNFNHKLCNSEWCPMKGWYDLDPEDEL